MSAPIPRTGAFDGLNAFQADYKERLNWVAEQAFHYHSHRSAIARVIKIIEKEYGEGGGSSHMAPGIIRAVHGTGRLAVYSADVQDDTLFVRDVTLQPPKNRLGGGEIEIIAASVGDDCILIARPDNDAVNLYQLTEKEDWGDCGSSSPPPGLAMPPSGSVAAASSLPITQSKLQQGGLSPAEELDYLLSRHGSPVFNTISSAIDCTAKASDHYIGITDTSAARTVTLPAVAGIPNGKVLVVKDESGAAGTNNITVDASGAELIDGAATYVISTNYGSVSIIKRGTAWFVT